MTTETADVRDEIDAIVSAATMAMFTACGVSLMPHHAPPSQPVAATVAGVVGFTSDTMRGTLMLASTFALLAETRPVEMRGDELSEHVARDWLYLRDWAAELANQLVGRVKHRLFSLGVNLRISTPTALSGSALAVATPKSNRTRPVVFRHEKGELWVWWDAVLEPGLKLAPREDESQALGEGEVLLF